MREAEQRPHDGDVGIDDGGAAEVPSGLVRIASSAFCTSSTVVRFKVRPGSREGFDEARADALVGATGVVRAVRRAT